MNHSSNPSESAVPAKRFTVVIPTRHRNAALAACLEQLAPGRQTLPFDRYDVLVTDDGVAADANAMLAERFPWATWHAGPKRGPAANRNSGAAAAQGEWLVFCDDDCLPAASWLEAFERKSRGAFEVLEGRTTSTGLSASPLMQAPVNTDGGWLWSCNFAIKRATFFGVGGFDEKYPYAFMEDTDFRTTLNAKGIGFEFIPDAVVEHPPRPMQRPSQLAENYVCELIYKLKWGHPIPSVGAVLLNAIKCRLRTIRRSRFGPDSLTAAANMLAETLYLAARYGRLKTEAASVNASRFERLTPPYQKRSS